MELNSHEINNEVQDKLKAEFGEGTSPIAWIGDGKINLNTHPVVVATLQVLDDRGFLQIINEDYQGAVRD